MNSFLENLKTAFVESEYALAAENSAADPEYQKLQQEYKQLFAAIRERLGAKHGKLLLRLEEKQSAICGKDDDLIYLQGMIDCVLLLKTIRLI